MYDQDNVFALVASNSPPPYPKHTVTLDLRMLLMGAGIQLGTLSMMSENNLIVAGIKRKEPEPDDSDPESP